MTIGSTTHQPLRDHCAPRPTGPAPYSKSQAGAHADDKPQQPPRGDGSQLHEEWPIFPAVFHQGARQPEVKGTILLGYLASAVEPHGHRVTSDAQLVLLVFRSFSQVQRQQLPRGETLAAAHGTSRAHP